MRDSEKVTPSFATIIQNALRSKLLDTHVSLPGRVESYDHETQKASIKPLIKKEYKNGDIVELPIIQGVPVQHLSCNNKQSYIHLPLQAGDLGILIFCDKSMDIWLSKQGNVELASDSRIHDLSDAFFIPGIQPFANPLSDTSSTDLTIKHDNIKITLDPDGKISIEGASADLLPLLKNILTSIINDTLVVAGVTTGAGVATATFSPTTIASVSTDLINLDTLIP